MATASLNFAAWTLAWRELRARLVRHCGHTDCVHRRLFWRVLRGPRRAILLHGARYCLDQCLERALLERLRRARPVAARAQAAHRVPLGLLLLSRQQLTPEQLRAALAAQRMAGQGRIGDWLQQLGFASEQQVTAALARQWSCPLWRANFLPLRITSPRHRLVPQIPLTLLEAFLMIPVDYVETTATLHMAFGDAIDYGVLYAIEQMVGCHIEPCMAVPSFVRENLQALSRRRQESEVVFDRVADAGESARIIRSYCVRLGASAVTLAGCGPHLWARLLRPSGPALDLLLHLPQEPASHPTLSHPSLAARAV